MDFRTFARITAAVTGSVAAVLLTCANAHADPLTYREQDWIDEHGGAVCAWLDDNPTTSGVTSLLTELIYRAEVRGVDPANIVMGSVVQQCPQHSSLIPALN